MQKNHSIMSAGTKRKRDYTIQEIEEKIRKKDYDFEEVPKESLQSAAKKYKVSPNTNKKKMVQNIEREMNDNVSKTNKNEQNDEQTTSKNDESNQSNAENKESEEKNNTHNKSNDNLQNAENKESEEKKQTDETLQQKVANNTADDIIKQSVKASNPNEKNQPEISDEKEKEKQKAVVSNNCAAAPGMIGEKSLNEEEWCLEIDSGGENVSLYKGSDTYETLLLSNYKKFVKISDSKFKFNQKEYCFDSQKFSTFLDLDTMLQTIETQLMNWNDKRKSLSIDASFFSPSTSTSSISSPLLQPQTPSFFATNEQPQKDSNKSTTYIEKKDNSEKTDTSSKAILNILPKKKTENIQNNKFVEETPFNASEEEEKKIDENEDSAKIDKKEDSASLTFEERLRKLEQNVGNDNTKEIQKLKQENEELKQEIQFYKELNFEYRTAWEDHASHFPSTEKTMKALNLKIDQKMGKENASVFDKDSLLSLFALETGTGYDIRKLFCFLKIENIDIDYCYQSTEKSHSTKRKPKGTYPPGVEAKIKNFLAKYHKTDVSVCVTTLRQSYDTTENHYSSFCFSISFKFYEKTHQTNFFYNS